MAEAPTTSITLLAALGGDAGDARWTEFFRRYEPLMRAFLNQRHPTVEADDVIQETMAALVRCLPRYRIVPDAGRHFHNYLIGIVDHKAKDALRRRQREAKVRRSAAREEPNAGRGDADDAWRMETLEVAISQLLADETIPPAQREIFRHVQLMREKADDVAESFGTTAGNVRVIAARLRQRLADVFARMTRVRR